MLIETDRLILKTIDLKDAEVMFKYRSDPEVYKYQSWLPKSVKEVEDFIIKYPVDNNWIPGEWKQIGVYLKSPDELIGDIGLHVLDLNEFELGFTIAPCFQKKGYGKEAVTAVINTLLVEKEVKYFKAFTDPDNKPSIMLLGKLGFNQAQHLKDSSEIRGELKDDLVFELNL